MSDAEQPTLAVYCHCAYTNLLSDETRRNMYAALTASGLRVEAVPDLCALAAQRDPRLAAWFSRRPVLVAACYPRTIRCLLDYAGIESSADGIRVLNMRTSTTGDWRRNVPPAVRDPLPLPDLRPREQWVPWFPVLDYKRCTHCRQCLSFCPFGVYELDGKRVVAANPANCKNNCPACARICPQVAIVFPKVKDAPINGDEVTPDDVARQKGSAVEGETDLHALLARRRMKAAAGRFAKNLDAAAASAPEEAKK